MAFSERFSTQEEAGEFIANQKLALMKKTEEMISVGSNWDRVIREQPQTVLTAPQAAVVRAGKEECVKKTDGELLLGLWKRNVPEIKG